MKGGLSYVLLCEKRSGMVTQVGEENIEDCEVRLFFILIIY